MLAPISPSLDPALDWPSRSDIIKSQGESDETSSDTFKKDDSGWVDDRDRLWIPNEDKLLKFRILIAAHAGHGGHRGKNVTMASVKAHFEWKDLKDDVDSFVGSCLHCLATAPGTTIPRPLGHALHAVKPNKLLHFDYCFISPGIHDFKYVLVLKDDFSGYVWLRPTTATTAEVTATHLFEWFSSFGIVEQWVSDRGSHFANELISKLRAKVKSEHHFTLAYCPWSNGTVEVVMRELLRALRALLSEYQMPLKLWPQILPVVQSVLNNTILDRLGKRCPLTAFTSLPQSTPLLTIKRQVNKEWVTKTIEEVRALQKVNSTKIRSALDDMHKDIAKRSNAKRKAAVESHNRKTNVRTINFDVGDYVLRGTRERQRGRKPQLKWHGPFQVVRTLSNYLFVIKNLRSDATETAHGRRLKLFRNSDYMVTEELLNHLAYQDNELLLIEEFLNIRRRSNGVELEVKWQGFDDTETDWVFIETLREDVPVMLDEYLQQVQQQGPPAQRKLLSSL